MEAAIRNYGRDDVEYSTWYSRWMKDLARTKTRKELESLLGVSAMHAKAGAAAHLRAIDATSSMGGQSQRRAHSRNVMAAAGEYRIAISGALEIYDLFPEHTQAALAPGCGDGVGGE